MLNTRVLVFLSCASLIRARATDLISLLSIPYLSLFNLIRNLDKLFSYASNFTQTSKVLGVITGIMKIR